MTTIEKNEVREVVEPKVGVNDVRPVAFFIPGLNVGGAQVVALSLANELANMVDRPVHLIVARNEYTLKSRIGNSVKIIEIGASRTSRALWPLVKYLRNTDPIVVVSSLNYANVLCVAAAKMSGQNTPIVVREDNVLPKLKGSGLYVLKRRVLTVLMAIAYRYATSVVAVSNAVKESLWENGVCKGREIEVIGNPISLAWQKGERNLIGDIGLKDVEFISAAGRLCEQKGFDILLNAFKRIGRQDLHLVILGEGKERENLERQAAKLGITSRVHMPGVVDEPRDVICESKAFVLSSRWEGFGNVLVEALHTGVPVVATDCEGGPSWILQGGKVGTLVRPNDVEDLADGIEVALNKPAANPESRCERARQFDASRIANEYIKRILVPLGI